MLSALHSIVWMSIVPVLVDESSVDIQRGRRSTKSKLNYNWVRCTATTTRQQLRTDWNGMAVKRIN